MGSTIKSSIVTDGLVFHIDPLNLRSSIPGSTTLYDLTINKFSGTLTNGPVSSNGYVDFDGVNDRVVYSSSTNLFMNTISNPFSTTMWINTDDISGLEALWSKQDTSPTGTILYKTNNNIRFIWGNATNAIDITTDTNPLTVGQWYHITLTTTSAKTSSTTKIYVNGVSQTFTINQNDASTSPLGTSANLSLGYREYNGGSNFYNGKISHFSVYNKTLNATEILQNYNALKYRF